MSEDFVFGDDQILFAFPAWLLLDTTELWGRGLPSAVIQGTEPTTQDRFLILYTDRQLAEDEIRNSPIANAKSCPISTRSILRGFLEDFRKQGHNLVAIDPTRNPKYVWRWVTVARLLADMPAG